MRPFSIQFGTDEKYLDNCFKLIHKEIEKLKNDTLAPAVINRAKRQILAHFAMLEESNSFLMQSQARNLIDYGRVISREEFIDNVSGTIPDDIHFVANDIFDTSKLSKLVYFNNKK